MRLSARQAGSSAPAATVPRRAGREGSDSRRATSPQPARERPPTTAAEDDRNRPRESFIANTDGDSGRPSRFSSPGAYVLAYAPLRYPPCARQRARQAETPADRGDRTATRRGRGQRPQTDRST